MRATTVGRARVYKLKVNVPHYDVRQVEIRFEKNTARTPHIFVDGPRSPHRYKDGSLCVWHPSDAVEKRWVFEDGLLQLIGHIEAHLFREAWWRETGEWLGPEAPHSPAEKERTTCEDLHG